MHAGGGVHALDWATFALVLALLLLSAATFALVLARGRRGPRHWAWRGRGGPPFDPALATLSSRYARGEIGRDEFLRATDDVRAARGTPPGEEPTLEQPPPD